MLSVYINVSAKFYVGMTNNENTTLN